MEKGDKLSAMLETGWCEFNLNTNECLFSNYLCKLLHLESTVLPTKDFLEKLSEQDKEKCLAILLGTEVSSKSEFTLSIKKEEEELLFIVKFNLPEINELGQRILFGYLQCIKPDTFTTQTAITKHTENLLHLQSALSDSLVNIMNGGNLDNNVNQMLYHFLQAFGAARSYIFEFDEEGVYHSCTYECVMSGASKEIMNLQKMPCQEASWWCNELRNERPIILNSLDELPAIAYRERMILEMQNIASVIIVPLIRSGKVWGYMGIDIVDKARTWHKIEIHNFRLLANVLNLCINLRSFQNDSLRNQTFLGNLFHHMPLGYVLLKKEYHETGELKDLVLAEINDIGETFIGKPKEEFVGKKISELRSDYPMDLAQLKNMFENKTHNIVRHLFKETQKVCNCVYYSPSENEIVALFLDITEIEKLTETSDFNQLLFRHVFMQTPVGIEVYDNDGNLTDLNEKDMEIFGVKNKKEVLGVNFFHNPNIDIKYRNLVKDSDSCEFQFTYYFKKVGKYYDTLRGDFVELNVRMNKLYDRFNKCIGFMLINIDISEQVANQNKIKDFENLFLYISDFAKVGYAKYNLLDHKGYAIRQWHKNLGREENDNIDQIGLFDNVHPDDKKRIEQFTKEAIQGVSSFYNSEIRVINPSQPDAWHWLSLHLVVIKFSPEDNLVEVICVNYDVTDLKRTQHMLIEAKTKAETLDRLKSAFLANMSHEIRTPLNAIVGFSSLLIEECTREEREQYYSIIQENNHMLLQLISDILDLSKIEAGTFDFINTWVDINSLCKDIVYSLKMKFTGDIQLVFDESLPPYYIYSDRNRLTQVITNFINNALKFTTVGSITLGYSLISPAEIRFFVRDTGTGISAENLKAIFDRFVKLNSFIQGTGLGLAICKSIVEQMKGEIGVDSEEGKGSCFWFTHPYNPEQAKIESKTKERKENIRPSVLIQPENKKITILIAEDSDSSYMLLHTMLRKNYEIIHAWNGKEALQLYEKHHPDIILMDMLMPEMDGIQTTCTIRKQDSRTPIIAITNFALELNRQNALDAGCNDYLIKPISGTVLKDKLKEFLGS